VSKASNIEVEKRIFTIQGWIIDGVQDYLIIKQATTQWNISPRQAKRYLKNAYENWRADESLTVEDKRAAKIAELKQLKRSLQEQYKGTPGGISAIMNIEKEIIKLEGILPPKRVQLSGDADNPLEFNQVVVFSLPDNQRAK
jgi:CRISPR/Cas system-associated protein Csx1